MPLPLIKVMEIETKCDDIIAHVHRSVANPDNLPDVEALLRTLGETAAGVVTLAELVRDIAREAGRG